MKWKLLFGPLDFVLITGPAIPVRSGHPPNWKKHLCPEVQGFGVEYSVADVRVVDSSDNHMVGADLKGGPLPALK